jgi:hypothetical protein
MAKLLGPDSIALYVREPDGYVITMHDASGSAR